MKKSLITIATCLLFTGIGLSQTEEPAPINRTDFRQRLLFGLKAGVNVSNVLNANGESFSADSKLGFAGGAFLAIPIGKYFGIQPELMYSQKGFKGKGELLGSTYQITRTSTFIDIPILFAFKPSEFITILAGPNYAYLLKQKDAFGNMTTTIEQETVFENAEQRKNTFGFMGGLDLTLKHLVLSGRVGWDVQANNTDNNAATPVYKNLWYQATIGYRFYQN
jgi:hypothetical protein